EVRIFLEDTISATPRKEFIDLFDRFLQPEIKNSLFRDPYRERVFDTWSSYQDDVYDYSKWNEPDRHYSLPIRIQIKAIQIILRVWDPKTKRSRQITIVQDV